MPAALALLSPPLLCVAADVESLHESHKKFMASVRELVQDPAMTPEAWKRVVGHTNLRFVTTGLDGSEVELFPGGRSVHVPWTSRHECVTVPSDPTAANAACLCGLCVCVFVLLL